MDWSEGGIGTADSRVPAVVVLAGSINPFNVPWRQFSRLIIQNTVTIHSVLVASANCNRLTVPSAFLYSGVPSVFLNSGSSIIHKCLLTPYCCFVLFSKISTIRYFLDKYEADTLSSVQQGSLEISLTATVHLQQQQPQLQRELISVSAKVRQLFRQRSVMDCLMVVSTWLTRTAIIRPGKAAQPYLSLPKRLFICRQRRTSRCIFT